jgi:hypothetical protein
MWGNNVVIHSVLKKKITKLNSQPAPYEKNKIDKNNSRKKIKKMKKRRRQFWGKKKAKTNEKKNMWGKLKLNSQPAQY